MTDLREAAQMALEVLEYPGPSWPDARQKAAEALRVALAQIEREWHGLTDDEIDQIAGGAGYGYIDVARAIEQALKEKNNG